ncbi:PAS domain S-box protein [Prosthecochloris sp. N3]|uniref:histidine kinase n=1 Tax=Prosthecochloris ethylica TaxID=2743976 RepID=A0ABR9XTV1_9CHLB|nr:PAS domain S-box protein [Prosthecochloris ethylica]MBF0587292.1 PAS domain S-box protein [Prosthecochloris ethylica]MBF0637486.1 PAS domain S-box protein [Prosthecochloris ethylica]NUK48100.1 PAS domain S-box protein [Prosthecochloris ethylica]
MASPAPQPPSNLSIVLRTMPLFLPLMGIVLLITLYIYSGDKALHLSEIRSAAMQTMSDKQQCLSGQTESIIRDLRFLAELPAVAPLLGSPCQETQDHLTEALVSFSNAKAMYDQIRYLDTSGMEVLRINHEPGNRAKPVPPQQLQDKSEHYYFSSTIQLDSSEIYVSPFDLNIENGSIEHPLKPMLRFARKITENDTVLGIAVLNFLGKPLLDRFTGHGIPQHHHMMLLNKDGYYLTGAPGGNNWGFMFPGTERDITFSMHHPEEWKTIRTQNEGQFLSSRGLFTFKRLYAFEQLDGAVTDDYYWIMTSMIPAQELKGMLPSRTGYLLLVSFMGCLIFVGTLAFTSRRVQKRHAHIELEHLAGKLQEANTQLHENQRKLQALLSNLPGMAYRCLNTPEWPLEFVSSGCVQLTGYEPRELLKDTGALNYSELIVREDRDWVWQQVQEELANHRQFSIRYRITNKTGDLLHVHEQGCGVYDEAGQLVALEGFIMDITDQVLSQQAIRESEVRFRSLFEGAPDAIFLAEAKSGIIIGANRKASKLTGRPLGEMLGEHVTSLHPPDTEEDTSNKFLAQRTEAERFETSVPTEFQIIHRDGRRIPVEVITQYMKLDDKVLMYGIFRDITKRKEAEAEIMAKTRLLETVTSTVPAYMYMKNRDLTYRFANTYALRHFHMTPEQVNGISDEELFPAEMARRFQTEDRNIISRAQPVINKEEELQLPDGTIIPVLTNKVPLINARGEIDGIVCVSIDRSEQKKAEKRNMELQNQLQNSQKLETLGTLAGGIAHEFNNILTPVIGFTEIALDSVPDDSTTRKDLETVLSGAKRAKKLVSQMLTFSRKEPPQLIRQKLQPVIRNSVHFLKPSIPRTVRLEMQIAEFNDTVTCDANQIQQVILNLCTNAWQAMEKQPEGILSITLEKIQADEIAPSSAQTPEPGRAYARMSIDDTGTGMAKEELYRIFDPFYTTKEVGKGTGLGLPVVYGIIQAHKGWIDVQSVKDRGTTVYVYLPLDT